jgi:hypothetical protein
MINSPPWETSIIGAFGRCDPQDMLVRAILGGNVAPTPTAIGTTVARIAYFRPPETIVVNKIRYYGVGITTNVYRIAIYDGNTLARLMPETAFTSAANVWNSIGSALGLHS